LGSIRSDWGRINTDQDQGAMNLSLDERTKIFDKVCRLVETKHFNPAMNGVDWNALVRSRRDQILACDKPEEFEKEVHKLVAELKTSHTGFRHAGMRNIPARHAINATLQRFAVNGTERWMFQDVHRGGPAYLAGIRPGDLLLGTGEREIRPPEDLTFSAGESAELAIEKLRGDIEWVKLRLPMPKSKKHPVTAPDAVHAEMLTDEIGLLTVAMFPGAIGIDVAKDIDRGIAALNSCSRLIVDLRGNTGGGIGGLRLMSYLTPGKLEVGYSLTRKRRERGYRREELTRFGRIPSRKGTLFWLAARYALVDKSILVVTEGLGPRPFHGRVVLMVNEHTASAGEMVAAFAEENNLATIVGTKTPGRLLSGGAFKVGHGYILGLPVAGYLTWQGRILENNGIIPTVSAELSREALREGRDTQLEKAVEVVKSM
jgi:carboxyl-terminal processing protease